MARHYYIAEPFPDELIGSVLLRTARHRGLSIKGLTGLLSNSGNSSLPLLLSQHLEPIANATRARPIELLYEHTPFRYITAFMSETQTNRFAANIISGCKASLAPLVQSVTIGGIHPRFCALCVKEALATRGESYWHWKHNLPFVETCYLHHIPLLEIPRTNGFVVSGPPDECAGKMVVQGATLPALAWLAEHSIAALESTFRRPVKEWFGIYRAEALRRGFPRESTGLCSKSLGLALLQFYGKAFFSKVGWQFNLDGSSWPALMFRSNHSTSLVTGKHLVIQAFLTFGPIPAKGQQSVSASKSRDYEKMDRRLCTLLRQRMAKEQVQGRPSVQLMLMELGLWGTYKHERSRLPKTSALVASWHKEYARLKKAGLLLD